MWAKRSYPHTRSRRLRRTSALRAIGSETCLLPQHLCQPLFVTDEPKSQSVESMPGVLRLCEADLLRACEKALSVGVASVALFPVVPVDKKSPDAEAAWDPNGLAARSLHAIKSHFPELLCIADVALDPYTSHGQDGLLNASATDVENDTTVAALVKQALCLAEAGADILGPSDMMDGRVQAIRQALEDNGQHHTVIMSYSAKYASAFYGPFRDAVGSSDNLGKQHKRSYQMQPANAEEAVWEAAQDLEEGADILLVKPGMLYLDVIYRLKTAFQVPLAAYQVSGEYTLLLQGIEQGWLDPLWGLLEPLYSLRRAGADIILTYYATSIAPKLAAQRVI